MANRNYLSCADTAKLLRQALKESFPSFKFSVRSSVYSGGASIDVRWTDGPSSAAVKAIADQFCGGYFDGMIDYKGTNYHALDGNPVHFGADFIFCNREFSPEWRQNAVEAVRAKYLIDGGYDFDRLVREELEAYAPVLPCDSMTLARVKFVGDDGYGRGTVGNAANGYQAGQGYAGAN